MIQGIQNTSNLLVKNMLGLLLVKISLLMYSKKRQWLNP